MLPHTQIDRLLEGAGLVGLVLARDCEGHQVMLFGGDGAHAARERLLLDYVYVA